MSEKRVSAAGHEVERVGGGVLVRNASWTMLGRVAFMFAWAVVTPYMLGALGTDRFAIWALLFAMSGYFATFDLGLSQALLKYVAELTAPGDRAALRALIGFGSRVYAALSAAAVLGLTLGRHFVLDLLRVPAELRDEAGWSLVGMAVVLGISNLSGVLVAILNGRQRMDVTGRVMLWGTALQIAGVVLALRMGTGLRGLVVSAGLAQLAMGVGYWNAVRRLAPGIVPGGGRLDPALARRVFTYSVALQITNLGTLAQFQFDKLLLARYADLTSVAQFELGVRLGTAPWVLPMLILPPLIPAFAQLVGASEHARLVRLYWRATRYLTAAAFPLAAFLIVAAPALVTVWLGPGHAPVALATASIGAFLLITVMTGVCTAALRGMERPWLEARYHLAGLVVHVGLSLWLVPRYGLRGALLGLLISGAFSAAYLIWAFHRQLRESLARWAASLGWPVALSAAAAMISAVWPGASWNVTSLTRGAAWAELGGLTVVFAVVILTGYSWSGFVPLREVRELMSGALVVGPREPR